MLGFARLVGFLEPFEDSLTSARPRIVRLELDGPPRRRLPALPVSFTPHSDACQNVVGFREHAIQLDRLLGGRLRSSPCLLRRHDAEYLV